MSQTSPQTARLGRSAVWTRAAAALCVLILLAGVLPLYALSLYNHPYYDDYGFSAPVHDAWRQTGDLGQTVAAAWANARATRQNWQGNYTGTLLSCLQPGLFSESLYYLTTFFLLTAYLLCFGFLLWTLLGRMNAAPAERVCLTSLTLLLLTQFLPDTDEAFYWFNGGVGNTFIYSLLALAAGLILRAEGTASGMRRGVCAALLALVMIGVGGGSYSGGLFALLGMGALCVWAFARRRKLRFVYLALTLELLLCFLYSVFAPGNAVRAGMLGTRVSPVKAIAQACYYGVALMGSYTRLPLLAVGLLLAPVLVRWARQSAYTFQHPLWVLLLGAGIYCAQLTPTLYSGVFLGGGRTVDTYYMSYVVLFLLYEGYLIGWWLRRHTQPVKHAEGLTRAVSLLAALLLAVGCLGYKHPADVYYGPVNMAGGSAALSLLRGEAKQYDAEMKARELLLNDETKPEVTLAPLSAVPELFMKDLLAPGAQDDARPALCAYYHKEAILLEGGGAS